jgi:S-adenosylmethionine:tRNA ribosyltransferase-isomerase
VRLEDLDYDLPASLIAQFPVERREDARLMVVDRHARATRDAHITDLPSLLRPGDLLVVNETRVRPARLDLVRSSTGGRVELLFVRRAAPADDSTWIVLARPARPIRPGTRLERRDLGLVLEAQAAGRGGERVVRVICGNLEEALTRAGQVPLPPYIRRPPVDADRERYQTVFASVEGAVAAPTAGLHFSAPLLAALEQRGVRLGRIVLHVGPGTFRPVVHADPREHPMDEEYFDVPSATAQAARASREEGGRIVAVGTTVVRALESACDACGGELGAASGWTRKFILPPYRFRAIDMLLTNFHLPRTTLLPLVAAFAGLELTRTAYREAVERRYRFYSYGDAMLVV